MQAELVSRTHPGDVRTPSRQRKKRRKKSTVPQENQSRFTPWIPVVRPTALVSGSLEQRLVVVTIPLSTYTLKFAKDCITRSSRSGTTSCRHHKRELPVKKYLVPSVVPSRRTFPNARLDFSGVSLMIFASQTGTSIHPATLFFCRFTPRLLQRLGY